MLNKKFSPTAEQIRATRFLLAAMAHESMVSPIVSAYQSEILARNRWPKDPKWAEIGAGQEGHDEWFAAPILDDKQVYLMSAEHFEAYRDECRAAQARARLVSESPDHCPKLVAEYQTLQARRALVKALEPVTGITWDVLAMRLENIEKFIDLALKVMAPFVGDAQDVLQEVLA